MKKQGNLSFNVGRASPPAGGSNYMNMQSGTGSLISGTGDLGSTPTQERQDTRIQKNLLPGIKVSHNVERDVYGQPLSPTNMLTSGNGSQEAQGAGFLRRQPLQMQDSLKGLPKMAGLSSFEYSTGAESGLRFHCAIAKPDNIHEQTVESYHQTFHRGKSDFSISGAKRNNVQIETDKHVFQLDDSKFKSVLNKDLISKNENFSSRHMYEVSINLPHQLLVEQIEIKVQQHSSKFDLLKKYLKISGATKCSVINKDAMSRESKIGPDIQLTTVERAPGWQYFKLNSGYFDIDKKIIEINVQGVSNQVNLQFDFDKGKADELIKKCKDILAKKMNQNDQQPHSEDHKDLLSSKKQEEGADGGQGTNQNLNQKSNTQSQFMSSSYGGDFCYDPDGSDIDDLDNEVSNIAKKQRQIKYELHQSNSSSTDIKQQPIKHDDIQINIDIDHQEITTHPFEFTEEEKLIFEERKIFEGTNENQWAQRLIQLIIPSIKIIGFNMSKIPAITTLSHLMNTSFSLRKGNAHLEDALEVDFLLGTLLISSKRNTQAIEVLRNKVQAIYLKQIEAYLAKLGKKDEEGSGQNTILSSDDMQNLKVQIKKLYTKAAIIELMCAESMCIRPQINDKLKSLVRMTQLCRGQLVPNIKFGNQIFLADDEYTTMVKILPFMLKFTIQCLENNQQCTREIIIVSALRNIQFILETQGCSLDSAMIVILKSIFRNYPDRLKQEKIQKRASEKRKRWQGRGVGEITQAANGFPRTFLSEGRRIGGVSGTGSVNELNTGNTNGFGSAADIHQMALNPYSARDPGVQDQSRREKMTMIESIFTLSWIQMRDEPTVKKEPNSGFEKTLVSLFNNLLETYISVLSSISSHILHQIFYEVIVPCLTNQPFEEDRVRFEALEREEQAILCEFSAEVKIFAVKIAEKIITICQGDLIMNKTLLDTLVKSQSQQSFKKQMEMTGVTEQLRNQMKNLWTSIRSKVFTNYSMKGFKQLIEWLVSKMSLLAQNCTILDGKSSASEIAMLELSEDDLQQLSQYLEIITFISVGRRNNQEEANSLIKIKQDYCMDLYLLLNPLLFWLDFSVEREERLGLFKQVYQTIKDVLENLPPKKVDIDILQIIIPILQRTSEYLRQNSPTQSMLKFLDIVLQDIKAGKYCQTNYPDLQYFFLDQLDSIVGYISYCLYEDIFPVFDKLLSLCQDIITEKILKKCILALIDKYTMKSKAQKASAQAFMKSLMDVGLKKATEKKRAASNFNDLDMIDIFNQDIDVDPHSRAGAAKAATKSNFFEVMLEYCFFENEDEPARVAAEILKPWSESGAPTSLDDSVIRMDRSLQFRSPQDLHELYIDKLQFFIDCLNLMGERHISHFNALIFNPKFKSTLFSLLNLGETNLRLKCHEILEILGTYFIQYCSSKTLYELALPSGPSGSQRGATRQGEFEMMEVDFINSERLYIAQMIIQCVRKSFEQNQGNDSYLQFNSLILLDYLFQNILPVPTFQNEQLKQRQNIENQILQQKKSAQQRKNDNDSQLEDGSSGGEGTMAGQAARANRSEVDMANERQTNSNYLGEIEHTIDLETVSITESTPELEVTDTRYTAMRLKIVYKLWPYVQDALNSPWSNIRSICYGLICSMLKIDVRDCNRYLPYSPFRDSVREESKAHREQERERDSKIAKEFEDLDKELLEKNKFYLKLRHFVIPMMLNLLSSKESESKAGGLNILGSICGLSYDFSKVKISRNLEFFKRNSEFISLPIWQLVFDLQDDWDITIKEASIVLIQLCAPREAIKYFYKCKIEKENQVFQQMLNKMAKSGGGGGPGGHGSVSNLSSARQNSLYISNHPNSKGSLTGLKKLNDNGGGQSSSRRIDYKNVDFGYKNKETPNIPGISGQILNEFGKMDMATFLNDNQDMIDIDESRKSSINFDKEKLLPNSAREAPYAKAATENKQFALDLGKIYQQKDESVKKTGGFDIEAAFQQSSMSQRSNMFGANSQVNQQILLQQQQQNQHLMQAMQGQFPQTTSSSQLNPFQQFEFFVDEYSDDQIQEIISIFRNDFKPPKNLWIEKSAESCFFNSPDFYADIYSGAIEQFNQQQMILQQKQQQELQEQVSNGTSSSQGSALSDGSAGQGSREQSTAQGAGGGRIERSELSPPVAAEEPKEEPAKKEPAKGEAEKEEEPKQEAETSPVETQDDKGSQPPPALTVEDQMEDIAEPEPPRKDSEDMKQKDANKRFDPADLNIFELNFDEMNINIEDINQNKQKQDVINSSDSDIGGLGSGHGPGAVGGDEDEDMAGHYGQEDPRRMLDSEEVDENEDSQDCTREDNILRACRELEELDQQKAAQNQMKQEKYMQLGKLGTELQVIESMSNEVSASVESQKTGDIGNGSRISETFSKNTPSQYSSQNKITKLKNQDEVSTGDGVHGLPPSHQDYMLEEIEKKNSKTLQLIQQEKRHQQQTQSSSSTHAKRKSQDMVILDYDKATGSGTHSNQAANQLGKPSADSHVSSSNHEQTLKQLKLAALSSSGHTLSSGEAVPGSFGQQANSSGGQYNFLAGEQPMPFQAKTQVIDMAKHRSDLQSDLEFLSQQHMQQLQDQYEMYDMLNAGEFAAGANGGEKSIGQNTQKLNMKKLIKKQVSNSNSTPDFQMMAYAQAKAAQSVQQKQKRQKNAGVAQKHSSEIDSARQNFVKANIPLGGNFGNFSHRAQGGKNNTQNLTMNNPKDAHSATSTSSANNTKKQILKNLKQIKTNNEDYFIMQNISNQLGGQLTANINQGLNTTKNKKSGDKSFQNLKVAFKKSLQGGKTSGGTSLGRVNPNIYHDIHSSEESSLVAIQQKMQARGGTAKQTRQQQKSAGKKKTLSISPKRQNQTEIAHSIGTSKQFKGSQNPNSNSATSGGQRVQKTHRVTSGSHQMNGQGQGNPLQQFVMSAAGQPTKKPRENMKDLNYFIKTLEKFSKNSNLSIDNSQAMYNTANQAPQIMNQQQHPGIITLSSAGGTASAPQTPKDMIQGILSNLGDQMKAFNTTNPGGNTKKMSAKQGGQQSHKSKSSTQGNNIGIQQQQLYEQLKNQQYQGVGGQTAESIQSQLKKNGFNLTQLNNILSKVASTQAVGNTESGLRNRHGGSSGSGRQQHGKKQQRQYGHTHGLGSGGREGGSRGQSAGRGIFDLTPDSNSNNQQPIHSGRNKSSKSNKSNRHQNFASYSPPNRVSSQNNGQSQRQRDGSSANSRGAVTIGTTNQINFVSKSKNKQMSFNGNQPPQLNNLLLMNYSQTQKFDLRDINKQLMAATNIHNQKGGSTQHKDHKNEIMLNQNSSNLKAMHSQRERARERSAGSANSTTGGHYPQQQNFMHPQSAAQNQNNAQLNIGYNSLLLANNKYATQAPPRGGSHHQYRKVQSPQTDQSAKPARKSSARNKPGAPGSARSGTGVNEHRQFNKSLQNPTGATLAKLGTQSGLAPVKKSSLTQEATASGTGNISKTPNKGQRDMQTARTKKTTLV